MLILIKTILIYLQLNSLSFEFIEIFISKCKYKMQYFVYYHY